jgi:hypothetical protein
MSQLREPTNPYLNTPAYAVEEHVADLLQLFAKNGSDELFAQAHQLLSQVSDLRSQLNQTQSATSIKFKELV